MQKTYETNLEVIAAKAATKDEENEDFRLWLKGKDDDALDKLVHEINKEVSAGISCTDCGNCCSKLVVNITPPEIVGLSEYLELPLEETKEKYIEESLAGNCYINAVPCHFFADKKCTIYEARFTECRDFPHLHKPGFQKRLLGTLLHYGTCPIIYNVIEEVKEKVQAIL